MPLADDAFEMSISLGKWPWLTANAIPVAPLPAGKQDYHSHEFGGSEFAHLNKDPIFMGKGSQLITGVRPADSAA